MEEENKTAPTPLPQDSSAASSTNSQGQSPKKKNKLLLILLGLGIVAALCAGGYFLYLYFYPTQSSNETNYSSDSQSTASSTSSSQKNETADWKTYTSPSGYSVKYPTTWLEKACADSDLLFIASSQAILGACQSEFGGLINISYVPDFDYEDYIIQQPFVELTSLNDGKREQVTVAGKKAIKISGIYKEDTYSLKKDAEKILYIVDYKDGVLVISYYSEPAWGDFSETFEKIVSTLTIP